MDTFRVRLNCVDHYQADPTDLDPPLFGTYGSTQRNNAPKVPVIRVFGSTETGQKVCAHVHGALPYLYIEYRGSLDKDVVQTYIQQLRASIDHALAVSYRRNTYERHVVYVGHISLVKGIPFFGYHVGYRFFLKIYMLNPIHMTRFADLLNQGAIMGQPLQPFEAHLQYLAQWMCDFNLFGCAYMDCKTVKFRSPVPDFHEMDSITHKWHDESIHENHISDPLRYPRQSHCSLEVDVCVEDLLNRESVQPRDLHHDFVERFEHLKPDEKLIHSLDGLWRDETRRRKLRMGLIDPSSSPFPPEVLISMSADARNTDKAEWIHEDEYRSILEDLVSQEKTDTSSGNGVSFDDFVKPHPLQDSVRSALESVGDLFHHNLLASFSSSSFGSSSNEAVQNAAATADAEAVVNERFIPKFDPEEFPYDSDEEFAREMALSQKQKQDVDQTHAPRDREHAELLVGGSKSTMPNGGDSNPHSSSEADQAHADGHGDRLTENEIMAKREIDHFQEIITEPSRNVKRPRDSSNDSRSSTRINGTPPPPPGGQEQKQTPRKRTRFLEDTDPFPKQSSQRSRSPRPKPSQESSTPPNSQLSQSSIKAKEAGSSSSHSFPVIKDPYKVTKPSQSQSPLDQTKTSSQKDKPTSFTTSSQSKESSDIARTSFSTSSVASTVKPNTESHQSLLSLSENIDQGFEDRPLSHCCIFKTPPPTADEVCETMAAYERPDIIYQDAFYSNEKDVPARSRDYAGREFKLQSNTLPYLPEFDSTATSAACFGAKPSILIDKTKQDKEYQRESYACNLRSWEIANLPPSFEEVERWQEEQDQQLRTKASSGVNNGASTRLNNPNRQVDLSQVEGPTQKNAHGFKYSQRQKSTSVRHETQYMSTMSLEVHVNTRDSLVPDPEHDEIACVFWCLKSDEEQVESNSNRHLEGARVGVVVLGTADGIGRKVSLQTDMDVDTEDSELDLINRLVDIVRGFDPDVLTGYEVHNGSWGYLIERARLKFEYNLCDEFSRMMSQSHGRFGKQSDRWGFEHTSTIRVTGRHMINIWRAMRGEVNLLQYTMENLAFHLLHKRIPHYSFRDLTEWYKSGSPRDLAKVLDYFISRVQMDLEILEANELIPRTSEQARLIGVDFFSVFSRGSQFKVESFMFRIAKPENFILVSPSKKQVGQQNALECLPLVMEPQSDFYNSPLLVLDFQSLYPSIMIAYNYCYSTCLGRVVGWRGLNKMGFADFKRQPRLLELVKDYINIAPNGMMYVKPEMRKSLLAKMLSEILETRVMVKSGMKTDQDDKTLQQLLNNRQLALKLLANVTYGYTSASFSGRMPCAEIADSIVQTARETLEKTIAFIHSMERWNAEVVYGDTDSLFVYLKGRTREQAFAIGEEIAAEVTKQNPRPIKLKFEKVYHPCVLLAKKRYVGFKYESVDQKEPEFDAKGIETVRRDGTPAEQKIEEKALKLLFRTADLSQVKSYFQRQCAKIMSGRVSVQDFCFAKEVKLGTYSDKGPPPPGALISTRRMLVDPRTEPQYGERVPYVVITGAPGARLIDRCVAPEVLLKDDSMELDAEYYISKNLIPPLERIFNLVGANVRQWYDEMPKIQRIRDLHVGPPVGSTGGANKGWWGGGGPRRTLESYMRSLHCLLCRKKLPRRATTRMRPGEEQPLPLCKGCLKNRSITMYQLRSRMQDAEQKVADIESVCRSCSGMSGGDEVKCDSKDCPIFYSRIRAKGIESRRQLTIAHHVARLEDW